MCPGTFSRLRRSLATSTLYAAVRILAERFSLYRKDGILGENTCRALRQFLRKKSGEEFNCKIDDVVWGKLFPYLKGYTMHEIKSGDTLWGIAANYDTSVSAIMTANPTVNPLALRTVSPSNIQSLR